MNEEHRRFLYGHVRMRGVNDSFGKAIVLYVDCPDHNRYHLMVNLDDPRYYDIRFKAAVDTLYRKFIATGGLL